METKKCSKCLEVRPIDEFYYTNKAKGTRRAMCKKCFRKATDKCDAVRRLKKGQTNDPNIKYMYKLAEVLSLLHQEKYQIDHIVPLSDDGEHDITNLQILTEEDNKRKYNKTSTDFEGLCWSDIQENKVYYDNLVKLLF